MDDSTRKEILSLVERAVRAQVAGEPLPDPEPKSEPLSEAGACFVTLRIDGNLRGCIGTISPASDNLAQELVRNAVGACSRDPRFAPVAESELDHLEYSVSLLQAPESVSGPEELDPQRYGVIVSAGKKRGVLLPGIPGIDTVERQLQVTLRKAGIPKDTPYSIQRMDVEHVEA